MDTTLCHSSFFLSSSLLLSLFWIHTNKQLNSVFLLWFIAPSQRLLLHNGRKWTFGLHKNWPPMLLSLLLEANRRADIGEFFSCPSFHLSVPLHHLFFIEENSGDRWETRNTETNMCTDGWWPYRKNVLQRESVALSLITFLFISKVKVSRIQSRPAELLFVFNTDLMYVLKTKAGLLILLLWCCGCRIHQC